MPTISASNAVLHQGGIADGFDVNTVIVAAEAVEIASILVRLTIPSAKIWIP